ncbi:hypothetical protein V6Z11_D09G115600 [Gossypium hirsutum]
MVVAKTLIKDRTDNFSFVQKTVQIPILLKRLPNSNEADKFSPLRKLPKFSSNLNHPVEENSSTSPHEVTLFFSFLFPITKHLKKFLRLSPDHKLIWIKPKKLLKL